jgi:hypothetical protein
MASINSLNWYNSTIAGLQSSNGLVLGNKEGFYRDLGTDIFTNNDYVRVAIWYSFSLNSNPNGTASSEYATNINPVDSFYFGLKTPNASFPDAAGLQSKFCGYYTSPRVKISNTNYFTGVYSTGTGSAGQFSADQWNNNVLIFGDMSTPYTITNFLNTSFANLSTNNIAHGFGTNGAAAVTSSGIGVLGLELRNDNTILANYSTTGNSTTTGITGPGSVPTLSAMRSYINNQSFLSNTISLSNNAPYGEATAIFMYNPLTLNCIRVHGMIAAGFTRGG